MRNTQWAAVVAGFLLAGCATTSSSRSTGWTQLALLDYPGALESFDEDLESSQDAELYAGRARALFLMGRTTEAKACYDEALERDPQNAQWHVGLALVHMQRGDLFAAEESCNDALEVDSDCATALFNRGCVRFEATNLSGAHADFTETLRIDPNHAEAYNCRGVVLARTGRHDEAIGNFRSALRLSPLASAHGNCAAALFATGKPKEALTELNVAIRLERSNSVFLTNRGRIYLDLGRPDLAADDFEEALVLAPGTLEISQLLSTARSLDEAKQRSDSHSPASTVQSASFGN